MHQHFENNTRIHDSTLPTTYLLTSYKYLPYLPTLPYLPYSTLLTLLYPTYPTYPTPYDPRINAPRCNHDAPTIWEQHENFAATWTSVLTQLFFNQSAFFDMHENTNLGDTDTDTAGKQIPNSIENCTCILGCPVLLESERPPATLTGPLERGGRSISEQHLLWNQYFKTWDPTI